MHKTSFVYFLDEIETIAVKVNAIAGAKKIWCLHGEMGAGKTTFASTICRIWGVQDHISSPTYAIANRYNLADGTGMYHMDLFRLKNIQELVDIGFEDMVDASSHMIIEWPDIAVPILEHYSVCSIYFEKISETQRKLTIFTEN